MTTPVRPLMVIWLVRSISAASSILALSSKAAVSSASVVTVAVASLRRAMTMNLGGVSRNEEEVTSFCRAGAMGSGKKSILVFVELLAMEV
eukprot:CAMPEP_0171712948 /NCGR_PEP_ID=MMETSP0991-20121206/17458_1 /TAXON_ID=483369 /ORGANISM="non described non described, Strain CCMP2098" /LENGTH=90 /DNA_ID=CAMNT_0012303505 /DNA_START=139 /DNA_END=408 /DNA_ORIENTATION=+